MPKISLIRVCVIFLLVNFVSCKTTKKSQPTNHAQQTNKPNTVVKKTTDQPNELQNRLNISKHDLQSNRLYAFSNDWYGTPYKYGGCDRRGVDCSCFVNILYQSVYAISLARSAAEMFKACESLKGDNINEGDLVFFKIGGNAITHVGVYLKNRQFIHASTSRGVIVNSLDEAYYKKYFYCAGKVKKL